MMFGGRCHDLYQNLEAHYLRIRHHCQIRGLGFGVDIERPPYDECPKNRTNISFVLEKNYPINATKFINKCHKITST